MAQAEYRDWQEWHTRCALELCEPATGELLRKQVNKRFAELLRHFSFFSGGPNTPLPCPSPADCWHLFETHLAVDTTREGKRYKDWLFDRVRQCPDVPGRVINGGVRALLRDVVRRYLRDTCSPHEVPLEPSTDEFGNFQPGAAALLDFDPSPTFASVAARDLARTAEGYATMAFAQLTDRERVAMFARGMGLPLSGASVEKAAGVRKSALIAAYNARVTRLLEQIRDSSASWHRDDARTVAEYALAQLQERCRTWAETERSCAQLLSELKGPSNRDRYTV